MRSPGMTKVLLAGGICVVLAAGAAVAETAQEKRTKVMKDLGGHMGAIAKVAKGEADYSPAIVDHAKGIEMISHDVVGLFPAGSADAKSRSKPEIWSDWAGFEKAANDFKSATPALVTAAMSGDKGQIGAALGAVGKTCGGCHKPFRKPKE